MLIHENREIQLCHQKIPIRYLEKNIVKIFYEFQEEVKRDPTGPPSYALICGKVFSQLVPYLPDGGSLAAA